MRRRGAATHPLSRSLSAVAAWAWGGVAALVTGLLTGTAGAATDEELLQQVEALFASPYSEEMVYRTDRLLESSTGILESVRTAPSVATVLTAADLRDLGATTVEEALAMVPGLHALPSYANVLLPGYAIRGLWTSINPQVLVAVNGQPITFHYNGTRPHGFNVPVPAISRIEVIRGPGSALHGADAVAGVINIITKAGYEIEGSEAGARYGSFDTVETWLQHGGDYGGWDLALNLDLRRGSGDPDRVVERDMAARTGGSLAPGELPTGYENLNVYLGLANGGWQARLWGGLQHDMGLGNGVTQVLDPYGSVDARWLALDVGYQRPRLLPDLDGSLRLTFFHQNWDAFGRMFPPGAVLGIGADGNLWPDPRTPPPFLARFTDGLFGEPIIEEDQIGLEAIGLYSGLPGHRFRFGGGLRYVADHTDNFKNFGYGVLSTAGFAPFPALNDVGGGLTYLNGDSPYIFMQDQERLIGYGLAQDQWALARDWDCTAGLRLDHYSDFGLTANPRLALVWEATPALTAKLLYGRAFRPPDFLSLYGRNNPAYLGNGDLDPETVDTVELAGELVLGQAWRLTASTFAYRVNGLIEYVPPDAATKTASNFRDIEAYGGELEAEAHLTDSLRLRASYSYQHAVDDASNLPVPDAPHHLVKLNPHWAFLPDWSLDGQLLWVASRSRIESDTRPELDDYALVHLTLRRQRLLRHLEAACAVRNLFDTGAREATDGRIPNDIPLEGRSIWGELRLRF
ncbi:MAG: TonB-dependent receptor [Thermodesulfobacteriota bacterium]